MQTSDAVTSIYRGPDHWRAARTQGRRCSRAEIDALMRVPVALATLRLVLAELL
jgi:hypothetical protein